MGWGICSAPLLEAQTPILEASALLVVSKVTAEALLWIFSDVFVLQISNKWYDNGNQDSRVSSATCLQRAASSGVPHSDLLLSTADIWQLWEQRESCSAAEKWCNRCVCHTLGFESLGTHKLWATFFSGVTTRLGGPRDHAFGLGRGGGNSSGWFCPAQMWVMMKGQLMSVLCLAGAPKPYRCPQAPGVTLHHLGQPRWRCTGTFLLC